MSRLTMGWLLGLTTAVIGALVFYIVRVRPVDATVVTAFGVPLGALVWHGVVAVKNRNAPDASEK